MSEYVRICPKCGSNDVTKDFSVQSYGQGSFFSQFRCNGCGYAGQFFPEVENIKPKKTKKDSINRKV